MHRLHFSTYICQCYINLNVVYLYILTEKYKLFPLQALPPAFTPSGVETREVSS